MSYRRASAAVAALCAFACVLGCNAIFGVETGEPRSDAATSSGGSGGQGQGGAATSGSSSAGGAAGSGGAASGTGGAGGSGGAGGGPTCGFYDGDGSFTAEPGVGANLGTTTFTATQSISGQLIGSSMTSVFSIGGADVMYCGLGVHLTISNLVKAGTTYAPVSRATLDDLAGFNAGDNAFLDFGVTDPPCDPGTDKLWESVDGDTGTVKVDSVEGTKVTVTVTNVKIVADPAASGMGEMLLNGSFHADCFQQ